MNSGELGPNGMMPWAPGPGPRLFTWDAWGNPEGRSMGFEGDLYRSPQRNGVVRLRGAVLYPPPPYAKPPNFRDRPPGCRTIFVGGLPATVTEDILRELFEICGSIVSVRLSKKNFAHIRFERHLAADQALSFSGYRMRVEDKDDLPNSGRIHVDYAEARDDLHEYECTQRSFERENRLRDRLGEELCCPPSPPMVIPFTDHEALTLIDTLKVDETFEMGAHTLIAWFDHGECNRRTSGTFYSLLHSTNVHVRRLMNKKLQYTKELDQMNQRFRQRFETLIHQLDQIDKVFIAASKQRSWDHFTKAQRKNIEAWRKRLQDLKAQQEAEFFQNGGEAEMELSDGDDAATDVSAGKRKRAKLENSESQSTDSMVTLASDWASANHLREENSVLKCQLEAYKNEASLFKLDLQNSEDAKDKQIKQLQLAIQGMQQKLISYSQQLMKSEGSLRSVESSSKITTEESCIVIKEDEDEEEEEEEEGISATKSLETISTISSTAGTSSKTAAVPTTTVSSADLVASQRCSPALLDDREARLVALITTFLHVHPFGASIDYIWSYLHRLCVKIRSSELEDLLEKYPSVFGYADVEEENGARHSADKKWKFVGYQTVSAEI